MVQQYRLPVGAFAVLWHWKYHLFLKIVNELTVCLNNSWRKSDELSQYWVSHSVQKWILLGNWALHFCLVSVWPQVHLCKILVSHHSTEYKVGGLFSSEVEVGDDAHRLLICTHPKVHFLMDFHLFRWPLTPFTPCYKFNDPVEDGHSVIPFCHPAGHCCWCHYHALLITVHIKASKSCSYLAKRNPESNMHEENRRSKDAVARQSNVSICTLAWRECSRKTPFLLAFTKYDVMHQINWRRVSITMSKRQAQAGFWDRSVTCHMHVHFLREGFEP